MRIIKICIRTIYLIAVLNINSCIESYTPEYVDYNEYLVIEGGITNKQEECVVSISKSKRIGSYDTYDNPIRDALVTISDDIGNVYVLYDHGNGDYVSDPTEFVAEINREYSLRIETIDGDEYETLPLKMIPVPEITEIYKEYEVRGTEDDNYPVEGFQIYLNAEDASDQCRYFRYDFEEVWEVFIRWPEPDIAKRHCWVTEESNKVMLKNTEFLENSSVIKYPITYVSTETDRLRIKYSIAVTQFSLTQEEYNYWQQLSRVAQEIGTLYDPIPAQIDGNVYCCNNPDKKVLGFFSVNAVSTKRYFIKGTDHRLRVYDRYLYCPDEEWPGLPGDYDYYLLDYAPYGSLPFTITGDVKCTDCGYRGTYEPPDYWYE